MNSAHLVHGEARRVAGWRLAAAPSRAGVRRSARLALVSLVAAVLAACGDGAGDPAADGTTTISSVAACTTAPALFTSSVWKSMNGNCTACHVQGGVAGGSKLLFNPSGNELANYNLLRDYANAQPALLLSKTIGLPSHGGAKPYVDANSQAYKDLAQLIPEMSQQVCVTTTTVTRPAGGGYFQGVAFSDESTVLAKSAVLFAGRNPTVDESATATAGEPALRKTIRGYMQGPVFERLVAEVGDTFFLTPGVVVRGGNVGYNAADWPLAGAVMGAANVTQVDGAIRNRFDASARREPLELLKYVVLTDKPYTDMVAGNYTMSNGLLAEYLGSQVQGNFVNKDDDNEWRPATLPSARLGGTREHAGVLSTHAWLQRFPTTDTNRNRHRVAMLFKQYLATDVSALAARPLDDGVMFRVPTMENPACAVCHDTIDPVAAGFQNWNERNRFLPNNNNNVNHALPNTYRANSYPKDAANKAYYQAGDNWFRDGKEPGFGATPMPGGFTGNPTALQWLGQQVAADSRFALGAVHFWFEGLFGRAPLKAPIDQTNPQFAGLLTAFNAQSAEFQAIAARFATDRGNGKYNVRDLLVDLVMSQWVRADRVTALSTSRAVEVADLGGPTMLTPSQLNQKLMGLVGQGWNEFDNPYTGWGLNYGDFDGDLRVNRARAHTMMQSISIDRLAAVRSCNFAKGDFDKVVSQRLLFPAVTLADAPDTQAGRDAIVANVRHLHKALWKENVPATDAEVQRTVQLFTDTWTDRATASTRQVSCAYNNNNDAKYTGRAWAAVLAYMLGDVKFLYE